MAIYQPVYQLQTMWTMRVRHHVYQHILTGCVCPVLQFKSCVFTARLEKHLGWDENKFFLRTWYLFCRIIYGHCHCLFFCLTQKWARNGCVLTQNKCHGADMKQAHRWYMPSQVSHRETLRTLCVTVLTVRGRKNVAPASRLGKCPSKCKSWTAAWHSKKSNFHMEILFLS